MSNGKRGRPDGYIKIVQPRLDEVRELAKQQATNKEIAACLGVGYSSFCTYVTSHPELDELLQEARSKSVSEVRAALFKRAVGFTETDKKVSMKKTPDGASQEYIEETTKYYPPDVNAIGMFLRNYDPDWNDKDAWTRAKAELELELKERSIELSKF